MTRRTLAAVAVAALAGTLVVLSGCSRQPVKPPAAAPASVAWERVTPERLPSELRSWFEQNRNVTGAHARRTGNKTYVLVAWGKKPTGGYEVRVEDIVHGVKQPALVVVALSAPRPGQAVTEALTYPFELFSVDLLPGQLTFAYQGQSILAPAAQSPSTPPAPQTAPAGQESKFQVVQPPFASVIHSPVRVAGRTSAFEGQFDVEIEDGHNVLAKQHVTGKEVAIGWWEFDLEIPFAKPTNPYGAIIFVTYSPKDGARQEHVIAPVRFELGGQQ